MRQDHVNHTWLQGLRWLSEHTEAEVAGFILELGDYLDGYMYVFPYRETAVTANLDQGKQGSIRARPGLLASRGTLLGGQGTGCSMFRESSHQGWAVQ
jgi:hypothetical protein